MGFYNGKKIAFMIIAMIAFGAILTAVIMMLWNWLMPNLFDLQMITYWQALGIFVLSKILFGGWVHNKKCHHCHDNGTRSWKRMNLDDKQSMKEKFMQKWSKCHFEEPEIPDQTENPEGKI